MLMSCHILTLILTCIIDKFQCDVWHFKGGRAWGEGTGHVRSPKHSPLHDSMDWGLRLERFGQPQHLWAIMLPVSMKKPFPVYFSLLIVSIPDILIILHLNLNLISSEPTVRRRTVLLRAWETCHLSQSQSQRAEAQTPGMCFQSLMLNKPIHCC